MFRTFGRLITIALLVREGCLMLINGYIEVDFKGGLASSGGRPLF